MSNTLIEKAPSVSASGINASPMVKASQVAQVRTFSPLTWCVITCVLLALSGGIRFGRELQFRSVYQENSNCPFKLSDLPKVMGTWHAVEGGESRLDSETARITGSTDHIVRVYADEKSGDQVSVLVLYGPADRVYAHTPVNCYPAAGYQVALAPVEGELPNSGLDTPVKFSRAYYVKNVGGLSEYNEALWTFRHNGLWLGDVQGRWKSFRYHPAMFKIQVHRPALSLATEDTPSESLVKEIVREIESRIGTRDAATANASSSEHASTK